MAKKNIDMTQGNLARELVGEYVDGVFRTSREDVYEIPNLSLTAETDRSVYLPEDFYIVSNLKRSENFRAGTDNDSVADGRMTLSCIFTCTSKSYALIYGNIITNFSCFTDYNGHAMVNETSAADFCTWMNFNSRKKSGQL
jgi:hypothetical protein